MDKNEILEKSRSENNGRDFADISASKEGMTLGWIITTVLVIVVYIADFVIFRRIPNEMLFAVTAGLSALFIRKYTMLHKKHELFIGISYGIAALAWLTAYIIQIATR